MSQEKYIGMDVHQATISVAVMDSSGKLIMECLLETKAATMSGVRPRTARTLSVTFEEGTSAAWLHDLLKPHVGRLVVCDPRKNALLKDGNKSDRIDARKLAELLRTNQLKPVYHGEHGVRTLKELGRSYLTLTQDVTRVMNRIKALYRSWAIPCSGTTVYAPRHRAEWLAKIGNPEFGFEPNGFTSNWMCLQPVRLEARRDLLSESHKHPAVRATSPDSFDRPDSLGLTGGIAADTPPFPYQATTLGLQRFRGRDSRQRRVPLCARQIATQPRAHHGARVERQLQQGSEESVQRGCYLCQHPPWPAPRLLGGSGGERDAADDGPSHPGTKDCHHHFNHLEERSKFRPPTVASASRLSLSGEEGFPSRDFLGWWSLRF